MSSSESVIRIKDVKLSDDALLEHGFCPDCLTQSLEIKDGDLVCNRCGFVHQNVLEAEARIPFGETRSPTCPLVTDDSLGSFMSSGDLFKVLVKSDPLRAGHEIGINQIRVLTQRSKHPIIENMDKHGSKLMRKWLNVKEDSNLSDVFAHTLGNVINKVGLTLVLTNNGRQARKMTEAAFLWVWIKMGLPEVSRLRWGLWPKKGGIPEIRLVNQIMKT